MERMKMQPSSGRRTKKVVRMCDVSDSDDDFVDPVVKKSNRTPRSGETATPTSDSSGTSSKPSSSKRACRRPPRERLSQEELSLIELIKQESLREAHFSEKRLPDDSNDMNRTCTRTNIDRGEDFLVSTDANSTVSLHPTAVSNAPPSLSPAHATKRPTGECQHNVDGDQAVDKDTRVVNIGTARADPSTPVGRKQGVTENARTEATSGTESTSSADEDDAYSASSSAASESDASSGDGNHSDDSVDFSTTKRATKKHQRKQDQTKKVQKRPILQRSALDSRPNDMKKAATNRKKVAGASAASGSHPISTVAPVVFTTPPNEGNAQPRVSRSKPAAKRNSKVSASTPTAARAGRATSGKPFIDSTCARTPSHTCKTPKPTPMSTAVDATKRQRPPAVRGGMVRTGLGGVRLVGTTGGPRKVRVGLSRSGGGGLHRKVKS
eukprot:m.200420 g.200420  ORF g.200420 m.200420 type:complete len:439 (-) comp18792_c0_seq1:382-1698(-)